MNSPLNSYIYIHWILDFKFILLSNDDLDIAAGVPTLQKVTQAMHKMKSGRHLELTTSAQKCS